MKDGSSNEQIQRRKTVFQSTTSKAYETGRLVFCGGLAGMIAKVRIVIELRLIFYLHLRYNLT